MAMFSFLMTSSAFAQSCNSLKEIFENADSCDNKEVSIHGKVYEVLDDTTLQGSKYVYSFQVTDDGEYIVRVVSQDKLFFVKNDEIVVNGEYHKKLYVDGINLDDAIVASGKNIKVVLTGEEYTDLLINYVGKGILKNESLQKINIILAALIPLFVAAAFYFGFIFYRRKQIKGSTFEGYIERLFSKQEWRLAESNAYRKLGRWVESYSNPDFVFIHRRTNKKIAVECKYKEKEYKTILWAYEDQIDKYQSFSQKNDIPVFVVIGVGGRPKNPKRMFLIPLASIKYPDVKLEYLQNFERDSKKYFSIHKDYLV